MYEFKEAIAWTGLILLACVLFVGAIFVAGTVSESFEHKRKLERIEALTKSGVCPSFLMIEGKP